MDGLFLSRSDRPRIVRAWQWLSLVVGVGLGSMD